MEGIPLGYPALYIAATLIVNLMVLQGHADMKGAAVLNFLTGALAWIFALHQFLVVGGAFGILVGAQASLFGFTYLMFGHEFWYGKEDNRAAGWYCLFVVLAAIPFAIDTLNAGYMILGINWLFWAATWFMFWVLMGIQKAQYFKLTLGVTWVTTILLFVSAMGWLLGIFGF